MVRRTVDNTGHIEPCLPIRLNYLVDLPESILLDAHFANDFLRGFLSECREV